MLCASLPQRQTSPKNRSFFSPKKHIFIVALLFCKFLPEQIMCLVLTLDPEFDRYTESSQTGNMNRSKPVFSESFIIHVTQLFGEQYQARSSASIAFKSIFSTKQASTVNGQRSSRTCCTSTQFDCQGFPSYDGVLSSASSFLPRRTVHCSHL